MESELTPPCPIISGRSHHAEDALGVGQGGPLWGRTPRWESLATIKVASDGTCQQQQAEPASISKAPSEC